MNKKQHRLNRFALVIAKVAADRNLFRSEREVSRRFNRTNAYPRRWINKESEPKVEDYEILAEILKINSVDGLLEFLDSDRDIEEFLNLDQSERSPQAKTASAILAIADSLSATKEALKSIAFALDPTQINYTSADILQECNVATYPFNRRQKLRLAALLRESANRYNLALETVIGQINIPATLAQELFVFPSPEGEHYVAETYLVRMLPYLFQVDHWEGDRPIFRFPLGQYPSVEQLITALKGNGVGV